MKYPSIDTANGRDPQGQTMGIIAGVTTNEPQPDRYEAGARSRRDAGRNRHNVDALSPIGKAEDIYEHTHIDDNIGRRGDTMILKRRAIRFIIIFGSKHIII